MELAKERNEAVQIDCRLGRYHEDGVAEVAVDVAKLILLGEGVGCSSAWWSGRKKHLVCSWASPSSADPAPPRPSAQIHRLLAHQHVAGARRSSAGLPRSTLTAE
jgi:hypothetical protein